MKCFNLIHEWPGIDNSLDSSWVKALVWRAWQVVCYPAFVLDKYMPNETGVQSWNLKFRFSGNALKGLSASLWPFFTSFASRQYECLKHCLEMNFISSLVYMYVSTKSHEIEHAKTRAYSWVLFFRASSQGFELRTDFRIFSMVWKPIIMENNKDALLRKNIVSTVSTFWPKENP